VPRTLDPPVPGRVRDNLGYTHGNTQVSTGPWPRKPNGHTDFDPLFTVSEMKKIALAVFTKTPHRDRVWEIIKAMIERE